ncbi:LPXTG cell wall anchor domain-containing protein [Leuconostoc citreum]|uniref:GbpC/Spa domain-containing protein n=1 Tax=Leuconostoc citreum TaxID=33964 RepID=UPI00200B644E|nr:GbpC/Spa domain-containing protein [Leuconostoc citreum]MCK8605719.1 LPXTG cell wall anchor domain-containing protein [Leuconostoc citreum]
MTKNQITIKTKLQKNWRTSVMLAGIILPLASTCLETVHADDTKPSSQEKKDENQGVNVSVDHQALDEAVKKAKTAGVVVKQSETKFVISKQSDLEKNQKELADSYQAQISKLKATTEQQEKNNEAQKNDKAKWVKEQAEIKRINAEHQKEEENYQRLKAAYDKSLADQKANTSKDGYATTPLVQALQLKAEGHAKVSVESKNNLTYSVNGKSQTTPAINPKSDFRSNPNSGKNSSGEQVEFYETGLSKGESVSISYDNLANSSYNGRKIAKLVRTLSYVSNGSDDRIGMAIANDPTVGFWYIGGHANSGSFVRSVKVSDKYYYEDGSEVKINGDDAKISAGSLNNYYGGTDHEHIERVQPENATFVPVNGSSITDNNGIYFANKDNSTGDNNGPKADDWDKNTAKNRYIGAGIYSLNKDTTSIEYTASTVESANDGGKKNKTTWFTQSTTLPVETALMPPKKPIEPDTPKTTEPELKQESAEFNLSELVVPINPVKDVKAGDTNDANAKSIDKQEVKVGDKLTYSLSASDLPKGRTTDLTPLAYRDKLPVEVDYESATVTTKDGKKDLSKFVTFEYNKETHEFTAKVNDDYLKEINQAKNVVQELPIIMVHVKANKANATFRNQYTLLLNNGSYDSNEVENKTGDAPKVPEKPKQPLKSEAPKTTPNTSYGEKPKGLLYVSLAAVGLLGGLAIFWKPIKKWWRQ